VGPLDRKWRTIGWKGRGVWCGKLAPSWLEPPPVSVKDRWIGPREQVLNVLITCWWYGSSKPSSLSLTGACLKRTASMVVLGEKLMWVPRATQSGWEVELGALFLRSSASVQPCWRLYERLLFANHVRYIWSRVIRGPRVECVWCVDQVSPTGCTSIQIIVTLRYEYCLFAAINT
jgi:hypothetical protein